MACGAEVSYALTAEGGVYAWGFGENMQLGNGAGADEETESLMVPTKLEGQALEVCARSTRAFPGILDNF